MLREYLVMAAVAILAVMAAKALFPKVPVLSNFAHLI